MGDEIGSADIEILMGNRPGSGDHNDRGLFNHICANGLMSAICESKRTEKRDFLILTSVANKESLSQQNMGSIAHYVTSRLYAVDDLVVAR